MRLDFLWCLQLARESKPEHLSSLFFRVPRFHDQVCSAQGLYLTSTI